MGQQQWEAERQLHAEASTTAAQTSTQLNAEFRAVEHDTSAEKDQLNRIQMQEFAIHAEEATDAQRQLCAQDAGEEIRRHDNASGTLVNYLKSQLKAQSLESSTQSSVSEAIESERHRLQNQESFLSHEAQKRECQVDIHKK